MKNIKIIMSILIAVLSISLIGIVGCQKQESPMEETQETLEEAGEETMDTMEEAGEATMDATEEGAEEVEEAAEEM